MKSQTTLLIAALLWVGPFAFADAKPAHTDSIAVVAKAAIDVTDSYLRKAEHRNVKDLDTLQRGDFQKLTDDCRLVRLSMEQILQQREIPAIDIYWVRNEPSLYTTNIGLTNLFARANLSNFTVTTGVIVGYRSLNASDGSPERLLADSLTSLNNLMSSLLYNAALDEQIKKDEGIHTRFERKLMKGFPAAPHYCLTVGVCGRR